MERCRLLLLVLISLGLLVQGLAQERNASALFPAGVFPRPGTAVGALYPPSILALDTALAVRYALMTIAAGWSVFAACEPTKKALNFWGEQERLSDGVCQAENSIFEMYAYSYLRAIEKEFKEPARLYGEFMLKNGYDPDDRSTDKSTAIGMGNAIGIRLAEWLVQDGWNSLGDKRRNSFGRQFEDYTGYTPVNSPQELKHPLRWQPLEASDFRIGRYTHQQHVVPFLGQMRPFVLTQEEAAAKQVDMPYMDMNGTELSGSNAAVMDGLLREVMDASKNLTPMQRFLAHWWDIKILSAGSFLAVHSEELDFQEYEITRWALGEVLAQHDAMVLAWKEKRRIDAVRPQTIARSFYGDERFDVFVSEDKGVQSVLGKDWEPLVATQPHSEFPSASAALCTAFADHGTLILQELLAARGLSEEPPYRLSFDGPTFYPFPLPKGVDSVELKSMKEAGRSCGESRVWAGVHFPPSIPAGEKLVEGVGEKAYLLVKDLAEGRVPKNCWWCTSRGNP